MLNRQLNNTLLISLSNQLQTNEIEYQDVKNYNFNCSLTKCSNIISVCTFTTLANYDFGAIFSTSFDLITSELELQLRPSVFGILSRIQTIIIHKLNEALLKLLNVKIVRQYHTLS